MLWWQWYIFWYSREGYSIVFLDCVNEIALKIWLKCLDRSWKFHLRPFPFLDLYFFLWNELPLSSEEKKFTIDWLGASFSDQYAQKKYYSLRLKCTNFPDTGNFFCPKKGSLNHVLFTWAEGFFELVAVVATLVLFLPTVLTTQICITQNDLTHGIYHP